MRLSFFMAAFLLPLGGLTPAQEPVTLTLDKSVELALQKNSTVVQARNTVDAAHTAERAAVGGLLPSLSANASFSRQQSWRSQPEGVYFYNGIPLQTGGSSFQAINSYSSGLSSRVVLFDGFSSTSNVSRTQADASATEFTLDRTEQNTIYQTNQLFLNVVRTQELLKVSEDNLKQSRRQLERIVESNKVGAVAIADVYRQQVQVGSDELALIQAQSNFEKAKADLVAYLGVDFNDQYAFDFQGIPSDIDTTEFAALNAQYSNLDNLVGGALERRPDYRASLESLNSAESGVTMARAGHLPTVSASGSFGYSNTELSNLTDNRNLYFSLNFTLPIFSGFSVQNQVEQAEVQRRNAEQQVQQAERQMRVDVRKALLDLDAAEKQIGVTKASVESAQMDRQIAEEKYNLGAGTLLDLLIANANYTTALSNKVNAVTGYLIAKKGVEFAVGTISR